MRAEPFAFRFGYQRADLEVEGPPIYPCLQPMCTGCSESTLYTGSGMGAIAMLIAAILQCNELIDIDADADQYAESRVPLTCGAAGPVSRTSPVGCGSFFGVP
jgi:hypothetical protein